MSIDIEQPLPTTAQHSSPSSTTMAAVTPSVASMSTISQLQSDSPQPLQRLSDYNVSPPDPEPEADEQVLEALRNPKDRLFVLKLGESMESLIQDRHNRTKIELTPSSSYHKLLVHRCAVYYRLTPVTEAGKKSVMLVVIPESRIPLRRITDLVPADDSPYRPFQIMRRIPHAPRSKASSQTGSGNDDSAAGAGDVSDGDMSEAGSVRGVKKKTLTLSERQAQYEEARSRIFKDLEEKEKQKSQDMSASSSTLSLLSVDSSSAGAPSGGGSSSVGESPDDSGSVDRDRDWDSSSKDKQDFHYSANVASGIARSSRPHNSVFNGSGHPSGYYPTLYDPSAPSGPTPSQSQTNHPHYQSPVYPVYSYGPPSFMPPYAYPYPYPPPSDVSGGHVTMNPAPPMSPNESSTSSPHEIYPLPPVSYMNPYMWSQPPHAPPNAHHPPSQAAPAPPEYGQVPFHNPPPNHPIHSHAYGSPMPFYGPPTQAHPQSPHHPHPQSRMHIPPVQPPPQPQMHPPLHTYQPQPQHPQQLFHPPPQPPPHAPQPQMPSISVRPHSLGSSPEGYMHGSNPMIVPNHTYTHPNGTKSQPPPAGYEHYMQSLHPTSTPWIPPPNFTYPQPSNNTILPPRQPSGKSLYDPAAEGESSQNHQSHLGPRFPYRRNGGRLGPPSNATGNQVTGFSGDASATIKRKPTYGPHHNSSQPSSYMSGSSSSTSTASSTSQSSTNSSRQSIPTSKHPLPARPDWAVGLKAQPTLHYSQNYPGNSSQRIHHNRLPGPSDGPSQADLPVLQSTDFPPLPLNANSNPANSSISSTANHRPAPGGAWAAHPTTRAFLGSNTNPNVTTDGNSMGQLSVDASGSTTGGLQQDSNGVPSRLDEPDRTFERPGPKVGGELFNPHATVSNGTVSQVTKNAKAKAPPNGYCKNRAQGGNNTHSIAPPSISNTASSDSLTRSDMTAGVMLIDRMAGLRIGNGREDSSIDDSTAMSAT